MHKERGTEKKYKNKYVSLLAKRGQLYRPLHPQMDPDVFPLLLDSVQNASLIFVCPVCVSLCGSGVAADVFCLRPGTGRVIV
ncbi:hypothetical protein NDU88_001040 [Pleurodeles waltl]|uniref:Uncharacterized protein n=1 Tax=Pleurodeles waltl TaxID=8319 RepID=A0AAV7NCC1_PLEWA|nr:hypothetical protein NDU88_001040 [Pleurodeles waltl]